MFSSDKLTKMTVSTCLDILKNKKKRIIIIKQNINAGVADERVVLQS